MTGASTLSASGRTEAQLVASSFLHFLLPFCSSLPSSSRATSLPLSYQRSTARGNSSSLVEGKQFTEECFPSPRGLLELRTNGSFILSLRSVCGSINTGIYSVPSPFVQTPAKLSPSLLALPQSNLLTFLLPCPLTASGLNLSPPRSLAPYPHPAHQPQQSRHGASKQSVALTSLLYGHPKQRFESHSLHYSTRI